MLLSENFFHYLLHADIMQATVWMNLKISNLIGVLYTRTLKIPVSKPIPFWNKLVHVEPARWGPVLSWDWFYLFAMKIPELLFLPVSHLIIMSSILTSISISIIINMAIWKRGWELLHKHAINRFRISWQTFSFNSANIFWSDSQIFKSNGSTTL